jgi:regulator of protease activity HflC (stomatin/prohibitin superfamily)
MECAHKLVRDEYEPNGLLIERLTLNSEIRLPTKVREAMEGRITASAEAERVRREVETIEAEGAKKIAAARAEAEALRLEAESEAAADKARASAITPETIRLKELEVQAAYAEKWNGQLPTTIMGDSVPLLQLTK